MSVVWKAGLGPGVNVIAAPVGARFLSVGLDGLGVAAAWFLCEPTTHATAQYEVTLTATGEDAPAGTRFLGTFSPAPGLVFHGWVR